MTLLLAHGYELLLETSEFSTNAIPNPYTRNKIKDTCLRNLYLRLLLDVSLISMYLSTPREQKGVTFLVCNSAIATSRFAQKYYSWSNPDYPNAERQQNHLEIPNFSQSNLKILMLVDKPEFFVARLWRVAGSGYKTVGQ